MCVFCVESVDSVESVAYNYLMETTNAATVADTILSQLGGAGRLRAMVGAKDFFATCSGAGLQFSFTAKARKNINRVIVKLDPTDTYTVELWSIRRGGLAITKVYESSDVYAESLRGIIERETGLYLSL
jgi:hypothetical protein